jgi:hypothetical protein
MSVLESLMREREAWAAAHRAQYVRHATLNFVAYVLTVIACYYAYRYHAQISDWVRGLLNL